MTHVKKRQLGRTGLEVSDIGFGAWQLGNEHDWTRMSDTEAHRLVTEAIDMGVNIFDTAPHYAATHSEPTHIESVVAQSNPCSTATWTSSPACWTSRRGDEEGVTFSPVHFEGDQARPGISNCRDRGGRRRRRELSLEDVLMFRRSQRESI